MIRGVSSFQCGPSAHLRGGPWGATSQDNLPFPTPGFWRRGGERRAPRVRILAQHPGRTAPSPLLPQGSLQTATPIVSRTTSLCLCTRFHHHPFACPLTHHRVFVTCSSQAQRAYPCRDCDGLCSLQGAYPSAGFCALKGSILSHRQPLVSKAANRSLARALTYAPSPLCVPQALLSAQPGVDAAPHFRVIVNAANGKRRSPCAVGSLHGSSNSPFARYRRLCTPGLERSSPGTRT